MSSMDGDTLEYFVSDSFMGLSPEQETLIVELLEPHRDSIEYGMESFEPEEQSWRSTRNAMCETYFVGEIKKQTDEICKWVLKKSTLMNGVHEQIYRQCILRVFHPKDTWTFVVVEPLTADTAYAKIHNPQLAFASYKEATAAAVKWTNENIKELLWNKS